MSDALSQDWERVPAKQGGEGSGQDLCQCKFVKTSRLA